MGSVLPRWAGSGRLVCSLRWVVNAFLDGGRCDRTFYRRQRVRLLLILSHTTFIVDVVELHGYGEYRESLHTAIRAFEWSALHGKARSNGQRLADIALPVMRAALVQYDRPHSDSGDHDFEALLADYYRMIAPIGPHEVPEQGSSASQRMVWAIAKAKERFPPLSRKDEDEAVEAYRRGKKALDRVAMHNIRLVQSISKRYRSTGLTQWDLFAEGRIGLIKGILRFDEYKGFKLATYVSWWIRHNVQRALSNQSRTVRLPVHMSEKYRKYFKGPERPDEDIAEKTGIDIEKIRAMRMLIQPNVSLDREVSSDDSRSFGDLTADDKPNPEEQALFVESTDMVEASMRKLSSMQANIIQMRFFEGKTLAEIGAMYNLSRERIRQLEGEALTNMRLTIAKKNLPVRKILAAKK